MPQNNYFDERGHILMKLYKKNGATLLYWETWNEDDKKGIIHWGDLGDVGEYKYVNESSHLEFKNKINTLIAEKIEQGYAEIPLKKQYTIAVTFKLNTWGTAKDLDRREQIRDILTDHLGWTGNGRCDDGDIGSGEMTLFAEVVDPFLSVKTIPKEFKSKNVREEYYFTISQGDSTIAEKIIPE